MASPESKEEATATKITKPPTGTSERAWHHFMCLDVELTKGDAAVDATGPYEVRCHKTHRTIFFRTLGTKVRRHVIQLTCEGGVTFGMLEAKYHPAFWDGPEGLDIRFGSVGAFSRFTIGPDQHRDTEIDAEEGLVISGTFELEWDQDEEILILSRKGVGAFKVVFEEFPSDSLFVATLRSGSSLAITAPEEIPRELLRVEDFEFQDYTGDLRWNPTYTPSNVRFASETVAECTYGPRTVVVWGLYAKERGSKAQVFDLNVVGGMTSVGFVPPGKKLVDKDVKTLSPYVVGGSGSEKDYAKPQYYCMISGRIRLEVNMRMRVALLMFSEVTGAKRTIMLAGFPAKYVLGVTLYSSSKVTIEPVVDSKDSTGGVEGGK